MNHLIKLAAMTLGLCGGASQATDVINQDRKEYRISVQGEGKLGISNHTVRAGGSLVLHVRDSRAQGCGQEGRQAHDSRLQFRAVARIGGT